jgi:hypothetical protein
MRVSSRHRTSYRRRFRKNDRAVAAVVGTLLALLVFLSIFGIFITEYVPLWMDQEEQLYTITVSNQMASIKQGMDTLFLEDKLNYAMANPVTLTSGSVPVFTQPTQGLLNFESAPTLYANATFHLSGTSNWFSANASSGTIYMVSGDRYYSPLTYFIEGDALISSQSNNAQNIVLSPSVESNYSGTQSTLYLTLFATYGNYSSTGNVPTAQVYTTLIATSTYYGASPTPVFLNISTYNPCAWSKYWNQYSHYMNFSGFPTNSHLFVRPLPTTSAYPAGACSANLVTKPEMVQLYFGPVTTLVLNVATFNVNIGVGNPV